MKTLCEKCIFADYVNSDDPCKMNIILKIKDKRELLVSDTNFYIVPDYFCKYGFDLNVYDSNKNEIGSIDNLKNEIINRAKLRFYLVINITDSSNIRSVCETIKNLYILPKYVSFILNQENNTEVIINTIKQILDGKTEWKIHNFLEATELNDAIITIFDTNSGKNDSYYFWINSDQDINFWNENIKNINDIVYIDQPKCHALFRSDNKDGLFLSFAQYKEMKTHISTDIFKAINSIENPKFIYYA